MVVGDDAQSIYGFRSADIRNILDFEDDFPDAEVIKLEQNYRSTQHILDAANGLIEHNTGQREKHLYTEEGEGDEVRVRALQDDHEEARWVVAEIERLAGEGVPLSDMAVLYRTNALSRAIETSLTQAELDYQVIGGVRFFDRAEVKDALSYLAWLHNPANTVAFARIVNRPRRGIGDTSVGRMLSHAASTGVTPLEVIADPAAAGLKTAAVKAVGAFAGQIEELRESLFGAPDEVDAPSGDDLRIADLVEDVLRVTGYRAELESSEDPQDEGRLENLDQLHAYAEEFDAADASPEDDAFHALDRFLQQTALLSDADSKADGPDGQVTLMTLHNAKGLEYDAVFLVGLEDGIFPHSRAIDSGELEEERRLAYVGITRARRHLAITWARRRAMYGPPQSQVPSRFLRELPHEALDPTSPDSLTGQPSFGDSARGRRDFSAIGRIGRGGSSPSRPGGPPRDLAALGLKRGSDLVSSKADAEPAPTWHPGQRVRHVKFDAGEVVRMDGDVVVVRFDGAGEKRLIAGFARLEAL
jgi:DNA helicase-2/ATP-dependent DNA helicase PcrA